ncbi:Protein FAF-like, chloroplastic [Sesbania bispinosa]|nr:Protein FAF-like, chloroplastic [Sesbania bispinosa]
MNKPIGLVNKSPKWSEKFNEVANFVPSTPGSFNACEYYWRTKPTAQAALVTNPFTLQQNKYSFFKQTSNEGQELLVLRGKNGDYLVHNLKSCKDSRRSFLFWEPYCIAT